MKYHKTVLGTQHAFHMKITGKKSKKMQKDMLYIKRKIEFRRGKVERKLLVQEQLTVEMEI